ncbi:ComF family protein [Fastidiosipila sanguinis]|uniref:Phosphoribosyltransferase domain-containing protein n=1 Tax=Fastidiosipila sanguinis TaxID=236753 RepID=A0A2S0KNM2_9FIRM|nr:phosphoribosyltransferase family protein [Fastidiosipila sanguinis]AVM42635.1 hypothetical protein C5Q98_05150 [Fastidiosipila sanguinis]
MSRSLERVSGRNKKIVSRIYKGLRKSLKEFLPTACALCLKNISANKFPRNICDKCLGKVSLRDVNSNLFFMEDPAEARFNFKSINVSEQFNSYYQNYTNNFYVFICTYYDEYLKNMIRNLKFHEGLEFVPVLADLIYLVLERARRCSSREFKEVLNFDYIVPLPLHKKRFYERGYNQVELIAKELAKLTGKEVINCLVRIKNTKRQSEMKSKMERLKNVENAFTFNDTAVIIGKKILLIDDVVSSGKTLWEAASVLAQNGAEVFILAITGNQKENYI